jgi:exopolysaccharide biosynthesis polyprenyl glycosylphosphotransferase
VHGRRKLLILAAGELGPDTAAMIDRCRRAGLEPLGFLAGAVPPQREVEGLPVLGQVEQLTQYVERHGVDEIIAALPTHGHERFARLAAGLQQLPTQVHIVSLDRMSFPLRVPVKEPAAVAVITLSQESLSPLERHTKRAFDLIVGTVLLLVTLPLLALIALTIQLDSPGRALFRQGRVGELGEIFWMYKFRSMVEGAEEHQADTISFDQDGHLFYKHPNDPRVTRIGRIIRRTSMDELPQLLNVLKGDMSLVGPRPELPWVLQEYGSWQWQRFTVPQGITGWWQVNSRSDRPIHLHTDEDLFYIQNYSLLLDIQILWKTVGAVIRRRGAY